MRPRKVPEIVAADGPSPQDAGEEACRPRGASIGRLVRREN
jgi:hypothetical protein